jgi:hypothetical protein
LPRKKQNNLDQFTDISRQAPVQFQSQVPKLSLVRQFRSGSQCVRSDANLKNKPEIQRPDYSPEEGYMEQDKCADVLVFNWFQSKLKTLNGQVKIIFEAQLIWSLRASEALGILHKHIMDNGLIYIPGKKGSNGRFIYCPDISKLKTHNKYYANSRIFVISYTAYYNALKRKGICFPRSGRFKLNCVTHSARKYNIQALKDASGADINELMAYTGHKSLSGLNYYLGKNKL